VSNDNYRDLMLENADWKRHIEANLLQYSFVGDLFLIADDPMGRRGPHLNQLLSTAASKYPTAFDANFSGNHNKNQQYINRNSK